LRLIAILNPKKILFQTPQEQKRQQLLKAVVPLEMKSVKLGKPLLIKIKQNHRLIEHFILLFTKGRKYIALMILSLLQIRWGCL